MPAAAVITYSGITNVLSLDFEFGHGILPGTAVLECDPTGFAPAAGGSLEYGVPGTTITLIDCLYDMTRSERTRSDSRATAFIQDRRWRWVLGPPMFGHYNQLDDHGKLIPRTVRSPTQLAALCLAAMGETSFSIDLPAGLAYAAGGGIPAGSGDDVTIDFTTEYLALGQNLPPSGTNLRVQWGNGITAAQALAQLCARFGREVVPLLTSRTTFVVPLGSGAGLPDLPADSISASIDPSGVPANVVIVGAESPFQMRFWLRAVAEEWDGSHVPLGDASYAPRRTAQSMRCRATGLYGAGDWYRVVINGVEFARVPPDALADMQAVVNKLRDLINASGNPLVAGVVTASTASFLGVWFLQVDAIAAGVEFEFTADSSEGTWAAQCVRGPVANPVAIPTVFQVGVTGLYAVNDTYTVTVNGVAFTRTGLTPPGAFGPKQLYDNLALDILTSANPAVLGKVTVTTGDRGMEIQAITADPLTVTSARVTDLLPPAGFVTVLIQNGMDGKGFEYSSPQAGLFGFANVVPTPNLNWRQAMELASRSVFKRYQLVMVDPGDRLPGVKVPAIYDLGTGLGRVTERHRVLLRDTMPEQTGPRGGDVNRIDPLTGQPYAAEYYDGYSRDRKPRCFGSLFQGISSGGLYVAGGYLGANTAPRSEFYIPFRVVDPLRGIIEFASPVFRILGSAGGATGDVTVHPAGDPTGIPGETCLVIETGAMVLTPDTQVPYRYLRPLAVPGGTGPDQAFPFDEVQVEYRGYYDARHNLTAVSTVDAYGQGLADLLAVQVRNTFQCPAGRIIKYYGIQPSIVLTGQVRQIKHHIGPDGFFTTASENTEFSRVLPPPDPRRRLENLPPNRAQVEQNLASAPKRDVRNAWNQLRGGGFR